MPFTISHVVAIFPFKKLTPRYLSFTALFVGSMAPDLEFFLRITLYGVWGHTTLGIFLFDLPVTILVSILFHSFVRDNLIKALPSPLYHRFHRYIGIDWVSYLKSKFLIVIVSALLGIVTHFIWDNFTHEPNYVSPFYFDFLSISFLVKGFEIPVYHFLQILSSVLGVAGFLVFIYMMPTIPQERLQSNGTIKKYWFSIILLTLAIIIIRYLVGVPNEKPFGQFVSITIGSCMYSFLLTSLLFKVREKNA